MSATAQARGIFWPQGEPSPTGFRVSAGRVLHWMFVGMSVALFVYGVVLAVRSPDNYGALNLTSGTCYAMAVFLAGRMLRLGLSNE